MVSTEGLREAVLRSGISFCALARELGWYSKHPRSRGGRAKPDCKRVKRTLGVSPWIRGGEAVYQQSMTYELALRIARAINADPVDVGL